MSSEAPDCLCREGFKGAVQLERDWGTFPEAAFVKDTIFTDNMLICVIFGGLLRITGR